MREKSKFEVEVEEWTFNNLMKNRGYIHCVDENGKAVVVRGLVMGERGAFVDFQPDGTHDSVYIGKRFVFDTWFAAWRRARVAARRFRASARKRYVTTASNGVAWCVLSGGGPATSNAATSGKKEACLRAHSTELLAGSQTVRTE